MPKDGLFEEIRRDHEGLKKILEKLEKTSSRSEKGRQDLFHRLKKEMVPHMKAEEKAFYPALVENKKAKEDALEAMEEHHVAEVVLKELDKMPKTEEKWKAKLVVFKEIVEHHIEEEESKVFDDAKTAFKEEQLEDIHEKFQKNKEAMQKRVK